MGGTTSSPGSSSVTPARKTPPRDGAWLTARHPQGPARDDCTTRGALTHGLDPNQTDLDQRCLRWTRMRGDRQTRRAPDCMKEISPVPVGQSDTDGLYRARSVAAGRSRRLAAWLAIGWSAFWLNSTVLACCAELAPKVPSSAETGFAALPVANPSYRDHEDPLHPICVGLTAPAANAGYAVPGSTDRPGSGITESTSSIRGLVAVTAPIANSLRFPHIHPPHAPLYLRTARLLI